MLEKKQKENEAAAPIGCARPNVRVDNNMTIWTPRAGASPPFYQQLFSKSIKSK